MRTICEGFGWIEYRPKQKVAGRAQMVRAWNRRIPRKYHDPEAAQDIRSQNDFTDEASAGRAVNQHRNRYRGRVESPTRLIIRAAVCYTGRPMRFMGWSTRDWWRCVESEKDQVQISDGSTVWRRNGRSMQVAAAAVPDIGPINRPLKTCASQEEFRRSPQPEVRHRTAIQPYGAVMAGSSRTRKAPTLPDAGLLLSRIVAGALARSDGALCCRIT